MTLNQRRSALVVLILFALFLFGTGIYFLVQGFQDQPAEEIIEPPPLVDSAPAIPSAPRTANGVVPPIFPTQPATDVTPELSNEAKLRILENAAKSLLERYGSGSSQNGFLGYEDIRLSVTPRLWAVLNTEWQQLKKDHPSTGLPYGILARAVAADVKQGAFGDARLTVTVQVLQQIDTGDRSAPQQTKAREASVVMLRQSDGSYLPDEITWKDVGL